jgi:hypothetical protein
MPLIKARPEVVAMMAKILANRMARVRASRQFDKKVYYDNLIKKISIFFELEQA